MENQQTQPEQLSLNNLSEAYNGVPTNKKPKNKDRANVLVLALSTFRKSYTLTKYTYGKDGSVEGYYQLEPVVKMLCKEKGIDHVIVLATDKTITNIREKENKLKEIVLAKDQTKEVEYSIKGISELDFFVYSIKDWLNEDAKVTAICMSEEVKTEEPKGINLEKIYTPLGDTKAAISCTINEIRKLKDNNHSVDLYVDIHGGLRNVQRSLDCVLSLMKNEENINIKGVYTVEHNEEENVSEIHKDQGYEDFDFVTGMDEFLNSGRFESLQKYTNKESKLISIIKDISEGFQLCNIYQYEKAIDELSNFNWKEVKDSYLKLFEDTIKNDYGEILITKDPTKRTLLIMEWCLKKGFYQQLLTMIETKMPEILMDNKYIITKRNSNTLDTISDFERGKLTDAFNTWLQYKVYPRSRASNGEWVNASKEYKINLLRNKMIGRFSNYENKNRILEEILKECFERDKDSNEKFYIQFDCSNWSNVKKGKLVAFLRLHFSLKALRNDSNHLLGKANLPLSDVNNAIKKYFILYSELYGFEFQFLNNFENS